MYRYVYIYVYMALYQKPDHPSGKGGKNWPMDFFWRSGWGEDGLVGWGVWVDGMDKMK